MAACVSRSAVASCSRVAHLSSRRITKQVRLTIPFTSEHSAQPFSSIESHKSHVTQKATLKAHRSALPLPCEPAAPRTLVEPLLQRAHSTTSLMLRRTSEYSRNGTDATTHKLSHIQ